MPVRLEERAADTVALIGELDLKSVPGLWAATQRRFRRQPPRRVDLSGIHRADSAGVALLVEWLRLAHNRQVELQFIHVPAQMTAIIQVAALDDVLPLANGIAK
jgi:phospholipid transport system transporter-binding protein